MARLVLARSPTLPTSVVDGGANDTALGIVMTSSVDSSMVASMHFLFTTTNCITRRVAVSFAKIMIERGYILWTNPNLQPQIVYPSALSLIYIL